MSEKSATKLSEEVRQTYVGAIVEHLKAVGETIIMTASNEFAIPVLDSEKNERWVTVLVKVPKGSRETGEEYDGYAAGQEYQNKLSEKSEKASAAAAKKEKDIAAKAKAKAEKDAAKAAKEKG